MRFMLLMIPKGYEAAAPDAMPEAEAVATMMEYNRSLQEAGILRSLDGLRPPSMGARISFAGGQPTVTDGPPEGATETLGGYWIIDVPSKRDAIEWASRCPASDNEIIEVRQIQAFDDFPADVQAAAGDFPDMQSSAAAGDPGHPVVHWELMSKDPARVAEFYQRVFHWHIREFPEMNYRIVETGGINGGIFRPEREGPWPGDTLFYIAVDDLAAYREKVIAAGGSIHVEEQDVPGMGSFSLFADPEGRLMGLWRAAP